MAAYSDALLKDCVDRDVKKHTGPHLTTVSLPINDTLSLIILENRMDGEWVMKVHSLAVFQHVFGPVRGVELYHSAVLKFLWVSNHVSLLDRKGSLFSPFAGLVIKASVKPRFINLESATNGNLEFTEAEKELISKFNEKEWGEESILERHVFDYTLHRATNKINILSDKLDDKLDALESTQSLAKLYKLEVRDEPLAPNAKRVRLI